MYPTPADVGSWTPDPVRCLDADASKAMVEEIDQAHKDGDTLGGVVEGAGLRRPRSGSARTCTGTAGWTPRLAAALMGIQAIKGVEVGFDGFGQARVPGSRAHDEILTGPDGIKRASGRSGGTEGGLTTGELLRVKAAMKPIATPCMALQTVDVARQAALGPPPAPTCARCPPPASSPRRWSPLCWRTRWRRRSAATASPRPHRNVTSYLDNLAIR